MKKLATLSLLAVFAASGIASAATRHFPVATKTLGDHHQANAIYLVFGASGNALNKAGCPGGVAGTASVTGNFAYAGNLAVDLITDGDPLDWEDYIHDLGALNLFDADTIQAAIAGGETYVYAEFSDTVNVNQAGTRMKVTWANDAENLSEVFEGLNPSEFPNELTADDFQISSAMYDGNNAIRDGVEVGRGQLYNAAFTATGTPAIAGANDTKILIGRAGGLTGSFCKGPTGQMRWLDPTNHGNWAQECRPSEGEVILQIDSQGAVLDGLLSAAGPAINTFAKGCDSVPAGGGWVSAVPVTVDAPFALGVSIADTARHRLSQGDYIAGLGPFFGDNYVQYHTITPTNNLRFSITTSATPL